MDDRKDSNIDDIFVGRLYKTVGYGTLSFYFADDIWKLTEITENDIVVLESQTDELSGVSRQLRLSLNYFRINFEIFKPVRIEWKTPYLGIVKKD